MSLQAQAQALAKSLHLGPVGRLDLVGLPTFIEEVIVPRLRSPRGTSGSLPMINLLYYLAYLFNDKVIYLMINLA